MPQTAIDLISVDDYLTGEQFSPVRHEYLNGHAYAMVGASDRHGLMAGSIFSALRSHLRGSPCQVFIADMKVRVESADDDRFYYPDVLVSCAAGDRERYFRRAPCLIVEVLSASAGVPGTEAGGAVPAGDGVGAGALWAGRHHLFALGAAGAAGRMGIRRHRIVSRRLEPGRWN
jgi:hypothetical protein